LNVTKTQSSRWQKLANLPERAFEAHVTETRNAGENPAPEKGSTGNTRRPTR